MKARLIFIFAVSLLAASSFSVAKADCFDDAATTYRVNPWVLRGIAYVESRFNPSAINKNRNGTIDIGITQINSIHLPRLARFGIRKQDLFDACTSIHVSAWLLKQKMEIHGNTWKAIGAYHSETPSFRDKYSGKVMHILKKWSRSHDVM